MNARIGSGKLLGRAGRRLRLFFSTVRYLSASQILHRLRRIGRQSLRQIKKQHAPVAPDWHLTDRAALYKGVADVIRRGPWSELVWSSIEWAEAFSRGNCTFLNRKVEFDAEPWWHDGRLSRLWRFHLHYFDYVQNLLSWNVVKQDDQAYNTFRSAASSWMHSNQLVRGDGWHPYTISVRTVNWLEAFSGFDRQLRSDSQFHRQIVTSLFGQLQFLAGDLEFDVRGNHLLKNLRALILGGLSFEGKQPRDWLRNGLYLLEKEIAAQILDDGGHFERNPGYHLAVLKDLLETGICLRRSKEHSPEWLDRSIRKMLDFLILILRPDGKLPQLKDTCREAAPLPCDLLASGALYLNDPLYKRFEQFGLYPLMVYGIHGWEVFRNWPLNHGSRASAMLASSGFCVMVDDRAADHLVFDAGKPCPEYLPAHAHADLLSYELVVGNQSVVVDSGVYEYAEGPWRDFFRSTSAHNTVEVEGGNQSEVWGSFRVGRRARPEPIFWSEGENVVLARGGHDGYSRLPSAVIHGRTVAWKREQFWLVVDELSGEGTILAANHVHLHPALMLERMGDWSWHIEGSGVPLWITAFGAEEFTLTSGQIEPRRMGWYSELFGEIVPNTTLSLIINSPLPFGFGYALSKLEPATVSFSVSGSCWEASIVHRKQRHRLLLSRTDRPVFQ